MRAFGRVFKIFVCPVWSFGRDVRSFGREVYYALGPIRLVFYYR